LAGSHCAEGFNSGIKGINQGFKINNHLPYRALNNNSLESFINFTHVKDLATICNEAAMTSAEVL
jgi:hypothetical protein